MSDSDQQPYGIYFGSRGPDFRDLIISILKRAKIKTKYIDMLTDQEGMQMYGCAFTSELVDPENNYQVMEMIGDLTGNKFIVNYMYDRFPQLECTEGVKVVARLRINYGAKQSFSEIARKLGFWEFISATNDLRQRKMKPLLEDVFEAFLGVTEKILDRRKRVGVGYAIVYDILAAIFDEMDISLRYEDLYDAKTRIKELFDMHEGTLGPLVYIEEKTETGQCSTVYRVEGGKYQEKSDGSVNKKRIVGGRYIRIGRGTAALKSDAQQKAAAAALDTLAEQGWKKPVPAVYQRFSEYHESKNEIIDTNIIKKTWGSDINALHATKNKTKYQSKYRSTPIAKYCCDRNLPGIIACLDLNADLNIPDSDGMFATDLLFIGTVNENIVRQCMTSMLKKDELKIHKSVFEMYYTNYTHNYFSTIVDKLIIVE